MRLRQGEELLDLEEDLVRRQDGTLGVVLQEAMPLAGVGPEAVQCLVDLAVQHQRGGRAEVIEQRGRALEEQRQVILDAGGGDAGAEVFVDAALGRVAFELFAPAGAKRRARRVVHREFAPGQQPHLGHRVQAALRVGVEGADRVDLVVEQVDAIGHRRAHRVEVDQAATHGVFTRRYDLADMLVAGEGQLRFQRRFVELVLVLELEGRGGHEGRRRQPRQCGRGRQQHDIDVVHREQPPQRGQALGDQVLVRAEGVVGQRLPVREHGNAQARGEERQLVGQALRVGGIGADDGTDAALPHPALRHARKQQRVGRTDRARQGEALARRDVGELHGGADSRIELNGHRIRRRPR